MLLRGGGLCEGTLAKLPPTPALGVLESCVWSAGLRLDATGLSGDVVLAKCKVKFTHLEIHRITSAILW